RRARRVAELLLDLMDVLSEEVLIDVHERLDPDVIGPGEAVDVRAAAAADADHRHVDAVVGAEGAAGHEHGRDAGRGDARDAVLQEGPAREGWVLHAELRG